MKLLLAAAFLAAVLIAVWTGLSASECAGGGRGAGAEPVRCA